MTSFLRRRESYNSVRNTISRSRRESIKSSRSPRNDLSLLNSAVNHRNKRDEY
jgi:hypothetical protein